MAQYLVKQHGYDLIKFADPLKSMMAVLLPYMGVPFDTVPEMIEGGEKEFPITGFGELTPRRMMQTLGTEWGRNQIHKDFWVQVAMQRISRLALAGHKIVIDDMRFENELNCLMAIPGAEVWRVERPATALQVHTHESEGGLDHHKFTRSLVNVGPITGLHERVDEIMKGY